MAKPVLFLLKLNPFSRIIKNGRLQLVELLLTNLKILKESLMITLRLLKLCSRLTPSTLGMTHRF